MISFNLVKPNIQVFRARFSEITPNSIRRACETFTEPNINISDAVDVRQELDLRIGRHFKISENMITNYFLIDDVLCLTYIRYVPSGASFTRFQTLRLQKIFPESLSDQLISYGSCQFPTLGFVVERFKAIQAFVPETFFKIKGTLIFFNLNFTCNIDEQIATSALSHTLYCLYVKFLFNSCP